MTTYANTWITDLNRTPAVQTAVTDQVKYLAWWVKAFLKNAGLGMATSAGAWTIEGSSDAVTQGLDTTDRWTDTYTVGKLVVPGTNRSWVVLKSPATLGTVYLCISFMSGNVERLSLTFATTAFTGGSLTTRPTSTTEVDYGGTSIVVMNTTLTGIKLHGSLANNGAFWVASSNDGTGKFVWSMMHHKLVDTRTGEAANAFHFCTAFASGGTLTRNSLGGINDWKSRKADNSATVVSQALFPCYYTGASNAPLFALLTTTDATDLKYLDFPMYILTTTVGGISLRGRVPDIAWAPETAAQGALEPVGGPYTGMIVGALWMPVATSSVPSL